MTLLAEAAGRAPRLDIDVEMILMGGVRARAERGQEGTTGRMPQPGEEGLMASWLRHLNGKPFCPRSDPDGEDIEGLTGGMLAQRPL